jgi:hypothetical protein
MQNSMQKEQYVAECLATLRAFIAESSNENKLEMYLAYEAIEDESEAAALLGADLAEVMQRILRQNAHDDAYLNSLQTIYNQ